MSGSTGCGTFNHDLKKLLAGERIELPTFNFKTGKREYNGHYMQLGEQDILVIEGIHCLNDALTHDLPKENKFKIYISALTQLNIDEHNRIASTDGRLIRRMVRDARTKGGFPKRPIAIKMVEEGKRNIFPPYQEDADVMFNSVFLYELAVLKAYAEPILFELRRIAPNIRKRRDCSNSWIILWGSEVSMFRRIRF